MAEMISKKVKVTLSLKKDVYFRAKSALHAGGTSLSSYIDDYLEDSLPILEAAVLDVSPEEKARAFLQAGGSGLLDAFVEFGDIVRAAREKAEAKEEMT